MKPAAYFAFTPLCLALHTHAAALERSGQSILPFLEPSNYTEFSYGAVEGNLSGENSNKEQLSQALHVTDFSTGNLIEDFFFVQGAVKWQLNPQISAGLLFDQPYGIKLNYDYSPESILGHEQLEAINIQLKSRNITALMGYQPTERWNVYGGLAYQSFDGHLNLFGQSFYVFNGYSVELKRDNSFGWLTGISYQIPEIAFRANLTYRSEINHKNQAEESLPFSSSAVSDTTKITTPQSVNLDFMSAISTHNLIYGSARWVDWSDFEIKPNGFNQIIQPYIAYLPALADLNLIDYQSDQWSAKIGVAHKLNERAFASLETVWDSGSDNPASTINPANGYHGLGTGFRYQLTPKKFFSGGIYYLRFRPSKADNNTITLNSISTLRHKEAWAYGIKIGHYF